MGYYGYPQLLEMGFKSLGKNVKISEKASIYNADQIEIGDNSRIDDFCVISGRIKIGRNVHIAPLCLVAGGREGIELKDFSGLAYGVKVFTQTDDYSGMTLTNPTVPDQFKNVAHAKVVIEKHVIVGTASVIMPGVTLQEGTSVGAMSLMSKTTDPWGIYAGIPAKRKKDRFKTVLEIEKQYLEMGSDEKF
jgi:acetyltransferase-like isoleucine patch superfamily enzyme